MLSTGCFQATRSRELVEKPRKSRKKICWNLYGSASKNDDLPGYQRKERKENIGREWKTDPWNWQICAEFLVDLDGICDSKLLHSTAHVASHWQIPFHARGEHPDRITKGFRGQTHRRRLNLCELWAYFLRHVLLHKGRSHCHVYCWTSTVPPRCRPPQIGQYSRSSCSLMRDGSGALHCTPPRTSSGVVK